MSMRCLWAIGALCLVLSQLTTGDAQRVATGSHNQGSSADI
jgi:hypothetical protein